MSVYELARKVARIFDLNASLIDRIDSQSLNQTAVRPPKPASSFSKQNPNSATNPAPWKPP